ncbi:MAG: (d)CMP kinase [Firmicutes bacterium]|nr:(d)CMP kinase [Bacillota bacterium]
MGKIVAIDGPAGSGKGTVANILAKECNLTYIDTGAMYRAIAYASLQNNIDISEEDKIVELANNSKIEFIDGKTYLNGKDISKEIRTMEVTRIVSPISSIIKLREILVDMQRKMAGDNDVIMEGRDITTVVFPDATYKFYLDATLDERAKRRYKENIEKGMDVSLEEIKENISKRDYNDMHKEVGALTRTEDSVYIDSTNLTIDEVVKKMKDVIEV